jgi:hypothetical protein
MNVHFDIHRLSAAAFTYPLLFCVAVSVSAQQFDPNNLPPCPPVDYSKKTDSGKTEKWNKCFGKIVVEFDEYSKGDVYEGEYHKGKLNGLGTHKYVSGNIYTGMFKDGNYHGQGTLVSADGIKFTGLYEDGRRHGYGIEKYEDGNIKEEGIWNGSSLSSLADQDDPANASENKFKNHSHEIFSIKPSFNWVGRFKNGLAPFRIGDDGAEKYGYIDRQGKVAISPQFDEATEFEEGLANVRIGDDKTGRWGMIDIEGAFVIQPSFDLIGGLHEGLVNVRIGDIYKGKAGFIDRHGNFVIKPIFKWAYAFSEGLALVVTRNEKRGFIDKKGKFIIKPKFDFAFDFSEGLAVVVDDGTGKYGFIDKKGKVVINFAFDRASSFKEGLAAVRVGNDKTGKWGFIDKQGKILINPQFSDAYDFREGLALVFVRDDRTGKFGFIDKQGKFVISPQFDGAWSFEDGLASVRIGDDKNGKSGFIDKQGKFFINPQFDNNDHFLYSNFSEGLAVSCLKENGKRVCGFVSKKSNQISKTSEPQQRQKIQAEDKLQRPKFSFDITYTNPDENGVVGISIKTNADTASLLVNGEEQGGRADGNYVIKKVARVGQDTQFKITASDINGNSDTKTITVSRQAVPSSTTHIDILKPETINRSKPRDAVAIIIGIQNYKRVPNAEFANNDAREFSEYAIRALGIKPEKIKILLDDEADEVNIVKAFENWLPIQVNKDKTDVYVFYSGHGLPSTDGKSLYFLPHGVDKELLSRTAVAQNEIVAALVAAKPKSVTMFIDACYSGQTRGGDLLLASAKPVALKSEANAFPANFTVITASANDQISSSSPELKHGMFSFYLMKGMEGDADANQDGKITVGEMQDYLSDKVSRQAMTLNRKQNTQLVGDANRVLVGR